MIEILTLTIRPGGPVTTDRSPAILYSSLHGELLEMTVRCTDYLDLAGEVLFMRESIDRSHDAAVASGVRIVHACGVDSIPSDLGLLLLAERAAADGAGGLEETISLVRAFRGGFSGGMLATMRGQLQEVHADPARRRIIEHPYALSPDRGREPRLDAEPDLPWAGRDRELGVFLAPFIMAPVNTRVVRTPPATCERYRARFAQDPAASAAARGAGAGNRTADGQRMAHHQDQAGAAPARPVTNVADHRGRGSGSPTTAAATSSSARSSPGAGQGTCRTWCRRSNAALNRAADSSTEAAKD